ncbi:MAG: radical SAM family heme chaperone HemW [Rhodospirillales bacterium]|nr:MAG: radical SAM family heme chaperone HemW [Rhodospirillales bacterium]
MSALPQMGVYIHWPWCLSKCPYCDFNSFACDPDSLDQEAWRQALLAELDHCLSQTDRLRIGSVFFGGGTPSLMDPRTITALLERLAKRRTLSAKLEISLEANPGTLDTRRLDDLKLAGINRLSLGVQALDDGYLKLLGRRHTAKLALKAIGHIQKRFDRCSIDLIYGRPGQSLEAWQAELEQALGLGLGHYSLYQLTYDPATPLGQAAASGKVTALSSDEEAEFYTQTLAQMSTNGRSAYEISNFALPKQECRHNRDIWRGGAYLGIGPGAHGRELRQGQVYITECQPNPALWLRQVQDKGHGYKAAQFLLPGERAEELVLMGLRLAEGIDLDRFLQLSGFDLFEVIDPAACRRLVKDGFLAEKPGRLQVTDEGRLLLDSLTRVLLTGSP